MSTRKRKDSVSSRPPFIGDASAIHRLVSDSPPLDLNSIYSYGLFGAHFQNTSIVAEQAGQLIGFISAYRIPQRPDTLFVWQVVVGRASRGRGVAWQMLESLLARPDNQQLRFVEATVTPGNTASRGLFERLAKARGTVVHEAVFMEASAFGAASEHEPELLLRIPLTDPTTGESNADL